MKNLVQFWKDVGTYLKRTTLVAGPYFTSDRKWMAWGLVIAITISVIVKLRILVRTSYLFADIINALTSGNFAALSDLFMMAAALTVAIAILAMLETHLIGLLRIDWRQFLTERYLTSYLKSGLYNQLELKDYKLDNPDQRIAMELDRFTTDTTTLAYGLFSSVGRIGAFSIVLWDVSGNLSFSLGGTDFTMPGYMFWLAVIYSIVQIYITHLVGRKLMPLNFEKQKVEADFRYKLVRLRENTESIALLNGDEVERSQLDQRFGFIRTNWMKIVRYQRRLAGLGMITSEITRYFPLLAAIPALFAGTTQIGGVMQMQGAFMRVESSLTWFATNYLGIAVWKSAVDRMITLEDAIHAAESDRADCRFRTVESGVDAFQLQGVSIDLPTGRQLLDKIDLTLEAGKNTVITGTSGCGKSTLFRLLSEQWIWGNGDVARPTGSVMFLPQKPYFPIGTLRAALAYPKAADSIQTDDLKRALENAQLARLVDKLEEERDWTRTLSGGEQQRLSLARALITKPDWLFLDESTSALDPATEAEIYTMLKRELPNTTLVSIAHRESLKQYHEIELHLNGETMSAELQALNT